MPPPVVCAGCKQIFCAPLSFKKQELPEDPSGRHPRLDYGHECDICSVVGYPDVDLTSHGSDFKIRRLPDLGRYSLELKIDLGYTEKILYLQSVEGEA